MKTLASALAFALFALPAARAQGCLENQYPFTFVDALGAPMPLVVEGSESVGVFDDKSAYISLSPQTPSGIYYVQVSDVSITTVLADSDQLDRVFEVTNVAGVISVVRLSSTPGLPAPGIGLGGVGQSIPLFPLIAPPAGSAHPCRFKAWLGTCYAPTWNSVNDPLGLPWGIEGSAGGDCCVRSFARFRVGDGSGLSTIAGIVFDDEDGDGLQDVGEHGIAGWTVQLGGAASASAQSDVNGAYAFPSLGPGTYTLTLVVPNGSECSATTPASVTVEVCSCVSPSAPPFGVNCTPPELTCDGHTPGFWSNPNGRALIVQHDLLARLPALNVRTAAGALFTTTSVTTFRTWLLGSNATNMAYKLSSHVVAMDFNRAVGFVDGDCTISDPNLGTLSIDALLAQAVAALAADGYTPVGDPNRALQERLKNALDAANNDLNWQ